MESKLAIVQKIVKAQDEYIKDLEAQLALKQAGSKSVHFEAEEKEASLVVNDLQLEVKEWREALKERSIQLSMAEKNIKELQDELHSIKEEVRPGGETTRVWCCDI